MTSYSERFNLPNTRTPSYKPQANRTRHICSQPDEVYGADCQSHVPTWRIACAVPQSVDRGQGASSTAVLSITSADVAVSADGCGAIPSEMRRMPLEQWAPGATMQGDSGLWRTRRADALVQRVPPTRARTCTPIRIAFQ
jgi:hypothetical protein